MLKAIKNSAFRRLSGVTGCALCLVFVTWAPLRAAGEGPGFLEVIQTRTSIVVPSMERTMDVGDTLPLFQKNQEFYIAVVESEYEGRRLCAFPRSDRRGNGTAWVTQEQDVVFGRRVASVEGRLFLAPGDLIPVVARIGSFYHVRLQGDGREVVMPIPTNTRGLSYLDEAPVDHVVAVASKRKTGKSPTADTKTQDYPKPTFVRIETRKSEYEFPSSGRTRRRVKAPGPAGPIEVTSTKDLDRLIRLGPELDVTTPEPEGEPEPEPPPLNILLSEAEDAPVKVDVQPPPDPDPEPDGVAGRVPSSESAPVDRAALPSAEEASALPTQQLEQVVADTGPAPPTAEGPPTGDVQVADADAGNTAVPDSEVETDMPATPSNQDPVPVPPVAGSVPGLLLGNSMSVQIILLVAVAEGVLIVRLRRQKQVKVDEAPQETSGQAEIFSTSCESITSNIFQEVTDDDGIFSGSLDGFSIGELIQFLVSAKEEGTLHLHTIKGPEDTRILFHEGQIIDSFYGPIRGESAVSEILRFRTGTFSFSKEDFSDHIRTVHTSTMTLLLDTHRVIDEERSEEV